MADTPQRGRLAELDALRGLAACAVLLFHYTWRVHRQMAGVPAIGIGLSWGSYGVHLFFAISGFVIFMTLERTRSGMDFAIARFARLFPAYWAGIAVTTLSVHLLGAPSLAQPAPIVLANLTMLQGFAYLPIVEGVYWSLTVELAFYLCMWGLWRLRILNRIEDVLLGWIALKALWWLAPALPSRISMLLALDYIAFFAIGIAAYRVHAGERRWVQQLPVLAMALGITALTRSPATTITWCVVAAIFVALAGGRLTWLKQPVLLWLGALSYPIYLVHQFMGYAIMARLGELGLPAWLVLAIAIASALGVAQLIHSFVEQPALGAIRGAWHKWRDRQMSFAP
jgi:peptidoglycan/LPS O-acetylase OafA/YrhL